MTIIFNLAQQGTSEWLAARRGRITASRFAVCRDRTKAGAYSAAARLYAMDVARERLGGNAAGVYANAAMRFGTEQEPIARMAYEDRTGSLVETAGFAYPDDAAFGVSVDGLIDADGVWECKTLVSSDTLYRTWVERDISAYTDQCNGALWLLGRKWVDLTLWAPDMPGQMIVIRIDRDDDAIEALESDLLAFNAQVEKYQAQIRATLPTTTLKD